MPAMEVRRDPLSVGEFVAAGDDVDVDAKVDRDGTDTDPSDDGDNTLVVKDEADKDDGMEFSGLDDIDEEGACPFCKRFGEIMLRGDAPTSGRGAASPVPFDEMLPPTL